MKLPCVIPENLASTVYLISAAVPKIVQDNCNKNTQCGFIAFLRHSGPLCCGVQCLSHADFLSKYCCKFSGQVYDFI